MTSLLEIQNCDVGGFTSIKFTCLLSREDTNDSSFRDERCAKVVLDYFYYSWI